MKVADINNLLGTNISLEETLNVFRKLAFKTDVSGDIIKVTVPTRRMDISIKEDIIEEVGRYYGMEKIVGSKLILPLKEGKLDKTTYT